MAYMSIEDQHSKRGAMASNLIQCGAELVVRMLTPPCHSTLQSQQFKQFKQRLDWNLQTVKAVIKLEGGIVCPASTTVQGIAIVIFSLCKNYRILIVRL